MRYFFFSNEGNPREPVHVHAQLGEAEAKLWLRPEVVIADSRAFDRRALAEMVRIVRENRELIERRRHEYFG